MAFDVIIRGGTIVDGNRTPAFRADVGIQGDRITAIGEIADTDARTVIDANRRVVSPGFIDVHNHSDGWLLKLDHLWPKTLQGFTTEIIMADGISYAPVDEFTAPEWIFYLRSLNGLQSHDYDGWRSIADYMSRLDGTSVHNVACHVPYANVRSLVCGFGRQAVDDFQMLRIQHEIHRGMQAGAVGLSTGLDYIVECCSSTDEIAEACRPLVDYNGLYVTHVRYKKGLIPAIEEAVDICRRAQIPLHLSHLKRQTPYSDEDIFACLERARDEVDLSFDVYPYHPGSTMLHFLLPYEVWDDGPLAAYGKLNQPDIRRRFYEGVSANRMRFDQIRIAWLPSRENAALIGRTLAEFAAEANLDPAEAMFNLLLEERLAVLCVIHEHDDDTAVPYVLHECSMIGTDGIYFSDGQVHPRMYGSAGRVLGSFVRERNLLSLEDAVSKLSGFPARRYGLAKRGELRQGYFADIVVFDPETISDQATFVQPNLPCIGIQDVLVNGVPIVANGAVLDRIDSPPGRWIKRQ